MDSGRILKLSDFHEGTLEHLIRLVNGTSAQYAPGDTRVETMMTDLKEELDERYTRIEGEVPGWRR